MSATRSSGFGGQTIHFSPTDLRTEASRHPLGAGLHVVHLGWFPDARGHLCERPEGSAEAILIFCVRGSGWCELNGRRLSVRPANILLIPVHAAHRYGASARDPWSIHWVHFAGNAVASYQAMAPAERPLLRVAPAAVSQMTALFQEASETLATGQTLRRLLYASQILRHLLGLAFLTGAQPRTTSQSRSSLDLTEALKFLRENATRSVTLEEAARHASLSPSRFAALFRERTGISPIDHHIRLRIQAASHLLDTSNLRIKEVAAAVGYEDPLYFSRIFRKITGLSPDAYRRSEKG